ncbi:uncharacterized protein A4U43_C02F4510 [Asparagus officinalis]|uniref:BHLH domain-containing protein n=1 Tax=Asparagus officinalis TaxID=4686 RepID=A0A5P1FJX4_ASPOF|nr:transcription factor FER-LIKE IRON DEFICIENCY-INDUCED TRANSCRIPTION FACTOR-like [Asparagus officinalis]ONK77239.1 uncharacterized protein A4U43_C02F4510 [Asparagus officinalis]
MDHPQLFFSTQTYLHSNDGFDPIIWNTNQGFGGFELPETSVLDNVLDFGIDLPTDAMGESPASYNLSLEEEEEDRKQNYDEGSSSRKRMKCKRDRSKTLVAERSRRSRMKEKLYALRSLVPNITKMDKASIIGDAIVYVQSLKDQAKKLADEISFLGSSPTSREDQMFFRVPIDNLRAKQTEECYDKKKKQFGGEMLNVMAHEVGEGTFYLRMDCNKRDGAVSALYSAIESFECFHVQNSDLSFHCDRFMLTLTLDVKGTEKMMMSASSLKLWVISALVKEGFGFEMHQSI